MKSISVIIIVLLCVIDQANGQSNSNEKTIGKSIVFKSQILDKEREIQVFLPTNYDDNKKKYPVLYVMDGQRYFLNGIAFQQNLTWQEIVPDFIIIGIVTDVKKRRNLFYSESSKFIQFLEKELIPKIDKDYRTINERIYFGWEMAAGLGFEILADLPSLFKGYLLSSPTHISNERLEKVNRLLTSKFKQDMMVYASLGAVETWTIEPMAYLDSLFQEHTLENVRWKYNLSDNENHYTTPLTTINEGLKSFFSDYGPLRFYSLQEFRDFGGIEALKSHYKNRGDRYQVSTDIHSDTKHYLLLQSHKEDNFKIFDELVKEFAGEIFIENYYRQARWFVRYSIFYLDNNRWKDAVEILRLGLEKFPNTSVLQNEMGNCFKKNGELNKAKEWYKEAIATAKKNGESGLSEYLKNLESL
ncbi:MAG: putative alpha/beta superfamily hydrolase [Saprospiraceae bacterium]|jgi:predicted alpha/beta superfamily hydrolase